MVPVEPISLAIGAVSLASLFSLCVQCFELIQVGKNLAPDFELLIVKLSIEKRRLMIWGEALGVLRPDEKRDSLLDEPDTRQLVERILGNIQRLFTEAAALKADYGLDTVSSSAGQAVQGSVVCLEAFEISPIVKFQTQFSRARGKTGLKAKTCWAIRDSKKFITMVQHLKDLIDGLSDITTSSQTTIQRSQLIRQETDLIPDLQTLEVIESTCSDAEWRRSASASSAYLNSLATSHGARRTEIHAWMGSSSIDAAKRPMFASSSKTCHDAVQAARSRLPV